MAGLFAQARIRHPGGGARRSPDAACGRPNHHPSRPPLVARAIAPPRSGESRQPSPAAARYRPRSRKKLSRHTDTLFSRSRASMSA